MTTGEDPRNRCVRGREHRVGRGRDRSEQDSCLQSAVVTCGTLGSGDLHREGPLSQDASGPALVAGRPLLRPVSLAREAVTVPAPYHGG